MTSVRVALEVTKNPSILRFSRLVCFVSPLSQHTHATPNLNNNSKDENEAIST